MKQLTCLLLLAACLSCKQHKGKEQIIIDRIEYVYRLKKLVVQKGWKGFSNKEFDVPLVYYTDTCCYVVNPTRKFIRLYKPTLISRNGKVVIYKTVLIDSIPFHMSTGLMLGDNTADYNHNSPFIYCSSPEITCRTMPGIGSTEEWAIMILHEYFHGFQFKHPEFLDDYEKRTVPVSPDSIYQIYKHNAWFKESVDKENHLLLQALSSTNNKEINSLIAEFFSVREQRRAQTKQQLNIYIRPIEETYETMEGTARYVEYSLYSDFATIKQELLKSDSCFHSYRNFKSFELEKNEWLYKSDKISYFYATGFNMVRLLDKLGVEYKYRLFDEGVAPLEQILRSAYSRHRPPFD